MKTEIKGREASDKREIGRDIRHTGGEFDKYRDKGQGGK